MSLLRLLPYIPALALTGCSTLGREDTHTLLVGEMNGHPYSAESFTESKSSSATGPDAAQIKAAAKLAAEAAASAIKDQLVAIVPGLPALTGALESVVDKGVARMQAASPPPSDDNAALGAGALGLALLAARELAAARARSQSRKELAESETARQSLAAGKKDLETQRSDLILGNERALATLDKDKRKAFLAEMERNHSDATRKAVWDLTP